MNEKPKKVDFVGKKFRVYQDGKLEGIARVVKVELLEKNSNVASCVVRFDGEPDRTYTRWVDYDRRVGNW